jgi:predicted nucleic acid-binding protein
MNGIEVLRYLLDTNICLYLLKGRLSNPLPNGQYFVSVITELELLSYSGLTASEEESIYEFLKQVSIVEIKEEIKQMTINLRRNNRLKLPDALISATAQYLNATLITNDTALLNLVEIKSQSASFT